MICLRITLKATETMKKLAIQIAKLNLLFFPAEMKKSEAKYSINVCGRSTESLARNNS